ncbi:phospholipase D-like domain-containing protein [Tunturiibacter gelidoferens]|uniref:Phosphatidylserine/phosphatidylglycerophosphate/ cardiolipin synthase-like enzyme n=1 Tax=Tunturiibacter gelidiferens TaxID=3069689 RepID=A0A9X0Q9X6_9BACT|nr:phosphatidylserine/phosphatidylglycerophosphate/cardiolipin synthase-like enzyme [Edaphobacter lichenicola]
MSRSLIVLPDDSGKPIVDAAKSATKSLRLKMFTFSDPTLIDALIATHRRGVDVRIMLNPARRNGMQENEETRKTLTQAGVKVNGDRRQDRLCEVTQLADQEPHGDPRLRCRDYT